MALLVEAAKLGRQLFKKPDIGIGANEDVAASRRINAIQVLLTDAIRDGEHCETNRTVIGSVYINTLENRPERLPQLFPLFAVLCGNRSPDVWIGEVDWNVADTANKIR